MRLLVGLFFLGGAAWGEDSVSRCRSGLTFRDGVAGTPEGHVIADMNYWISFGDWDLADVCFRFEHGAIDAPSATFVHAWALLRLAVQRQRGFNRAREEFEKVETDDLRLRSHLQALVKSIARAAPCGLCGGQGRTNCVRCDGARRPSAALEDICRMDLCETCRGLGLRSRNLRIPCPDCVGVGWKLTPKVE